MNHFTDKNGHNAIRSRPIWLFKAAQPRSPNNPVGAYFTTYEADEPNLSKKIYGARRIGGFDIPFPGTVLEEDVDVFLRATRAVWPRGFVETGDGTFAAQISETFRRLWTVPSELFIYESFEAYESWSAHGLTDENADKMVAVTFEADCISFVVNEEGGTTATIARDVIKAVRENRWLALPLARAA